MIVFLWWAFFGEDSQTSGHSEVNDYPAVRQLKQQVFGATLNAEHGLIAEAMNFRRHGPAQSAIANNRVQDGLTDQMRLYTATAGLDLW
jgi:hypothetical protein